MHAKKIALAPVVWFVGRAGNASSAAKTWLVEREASATRGNALMAVGMTKAVRTAKSVSRSAVLSPHVQKRSHAQVERYAMRGAAKTAPMTQGVEKAKSVRAGVVSWAVEVTRVARQTKSATLDSKSVWSASRTKIANSVRFVEATLAALVWQTKSARGDCFASQNNVKKRTADEVKIAAMEKYATPTDVPHVRKTKNVRLGRFVRLRNARLDVETTKGACLDRCVILPPNNVRDVLRTKTAREELHAYRIAALHAPMTNSVTRAYSV